MPTRDPEPWQHDHVFNQDQTQAGERRTLWVALLTAVMMVIEISAGVIYGSMALPRLVSWCLRTSLPDVLQPIDA